MAGPAAVRRLLDALALPQVFGAALDTGHLLDDGSDPAEVLGGWGPDLVEVQMRGAGSAPPSPGLPLDAWLARLGRAPAAVVVEHRGEIAVRDLERLVARLRDLLAG
jgi:sugar phosphate isomerase/epimerase